MTSLTRVMTTPAHTQAQQTDSTNMEPLMLKPMPELIMEVSKNVRRLDSANAYKEARQNNGVLIDVREPQEAMNDGVPQSVNIPRGIVEMKVPELVPDADAPIYIHCAAGGRACLAAEQLQRIGYKKVTAITCVPETIRRHWQ